MESVVFYMKDDLGMTYHEIAENLNRDDRTIWTVYNRAMKKKGQAQPKDHRRQKRSKEGGNA